MNKISSKRKGHIATRVIVSLSLILSITVGGLFWYGNRSEAATPSSGSLSDVVGSSVIPWTGDRIAPQTAANGEPSCTTGDANALNCDVYTLTVNPGNWAGKRIKIRFQWALPANDYDMVVRQETNGTNMMQGDGVVNTPPLDTVVSTSGNGTNTFEEVILSPPNAGATYYVRSVYFAVAPGDQYIGNRIGRRQPQSERRRVVARRRLLITISRRLVIRAATTPANLQSVLTGIPET